MALLGPSLSELIFLPHYSGVAAVVTELNKKKIARDFMRKRIKQHGEAVEELVTSLFNASALVLFDEDLPS